MVVFVYFQWYMWSVRSGNVEDVDNQHRQFALKRIFCRRIYLIHFNQGNCEEWSTMLGLNINDYLRVAQFNICLAEII